MFKLQLLEQLNVNQGNVVELDKRRQKDTRTLRLKTDEYILNLLVLNL